MPRIINMIVNFADTSVLLEYAQQILLTAISSGDPVLIQQVTKFITILGVG